ncbi:cilia- and flagella-associated protein 184 [Herpailurus yagouaroundi]|uniref:cilia- and flagella-associated protein 184 n=1 Tax=Herpailurus yagouaroundi TaxID=1608482 RepID=UPI001AD767ED|nr:coiled-coil domain-containing protein 96 [Puma yagouaroundi]
MDGLSEHPGDPEAEDGDVASLSSKLSGVKAISGLQSPAEPTEPEAESQPEQGTVEASAGGAAEDEPAEPREGPAATEAGGEAEPGEPEWPAELGPEPEPEPPEPAETGPEETAQPGPEDGLAEPEEQAEAETEEEGDREVDEEEEEEEREKVAAAAAVQRRRKEAPSQVSLPLSTTSREEAVSAREAEGEERQGAESEEMEELGLPRSPWRSQVKLKDEEQSLDDEDGEWTEEVQRLQEQQLRAELLQQYQWLVAERGHYQRYNIYLQHKISEALRKKGPDAAQVPDKGAEPEAPGKEQAYLRYLAMLEELRKQRADDLDWYHQELEQLKREGTEELARAEKEWRAFQALKKQVMVQAMGGSWMRGGRQAALRQVEQIQALEDKKEKEMSAVRLENVQLKQSLVHLETRMRAQEDLTEGLLLIDFEQLKIENQTFNEKVEERNEELLKLRHKVTHNVQIVTHVKEKLHFVDLQNACKKSQLLEIEAQVALRRDILTKTKKARDGLRIDNIKLNQKCGLLGKEPLLCDLEEKVDKAKLLRQRLESLKRHHAGLIMSCRGVKQKMREAKAFLPS